MPPTRYVALLRGINVGGNNLIKMVALKEAFGSRGFEDVATYIQSGNVLFETPKPQRGLESDIEGMLSETFQIPVSVVLRSHKQLAAIVADAPSGFGSDPAKYRSDVVFLKAPLTAKAALKGVTTREGVDEVTAGNGVLYLSRLMSRATQSRLNRIATLPAYKSMTIRNWNTTTKVLALLNARA